MKGNNELTFNQATMRIVVQEWITKNFPKSGKVTSVKADSNLRDTFIIRVEADDETPPASNS